jgi:hypothetical protein
MATSSARESLRCPERDNAHPSFRELIGAIKLKLDEASMDLLNRASDWRTLN